VRELKAQGMRPSDIAKALKIGRASVYRVLAHKAANWGRPSKTGLAIDHPHRGLHGADHLANKAKWYKAKAVDAPRLPKVPDEVSSAKSIGGPRSAMTSRRKSFDDGLRK
jgi:hypothetical protein